VFFQQAGVLPFGLVADHLHVLEIRRQPRARHLGFLVQQIALGDDHQGELLRQHRDDLRHMGQQFHLRPQHLLGGLDNLPDILPGNAPLGQFHGSFNHR